MKSRYRIIVSCVSIVMFLSACLIYVCNRSFDMVIYQWLDIDVYNDFFSLFRENAIDLPEWMLYNLPDALWLFSYMLFVDAVWGNNNLKYGFVISMFIFALAMECAQMVNFCPGTGDFFDILSYIIAVIVYFLYNFLIYRYENISEI